MNEPIVIVTVCKNPGTLLLRALHSVSALADPRVRHVVIDGASSDGTREFLESHSSSLWCWRSEPDRGIYDAMNKGWNLCPGDSWVLFLGADDRLLGLPSNDEIARADRERFDVIYGETCVGGQPFRSRWDAGLRLRNTVHHQSMLVRKSLIEASPFDVRYRVYSDWDFNLRLWRSGVKAMHSSSLRAFADPGGASASRPVCESFLIASRNSGVGAGIVAASFVEYCALRERFRGRSLSRS